jgi:hypothetical protein
MLASFDIVRPIIAKAPLIFMWLNSFFLTMSAGVIFKLGMVKGMGIILVAIVTAIVGLVLGVLVKYRVDFSVKYSSSAIFYFFLVCPILFGGSFSLIFSEIAGAQDKQFVVLCFYLLSIVAPILFGVLDYLNKFKFRGGTQCGPWVKSLNGCVDFEKFIITPGELKNSVKSKSLSTVIWTVAPAVTNIPLLFQIYTGSRNNAAFLAMPLRIGGFAYFSIKTLGPQIACLYLLRKYEKQTGRCFVNADYEKIQALRRTFFLSRWLMKDYRPASSRSPAA